MKRVLLITSIVMLTVIAANAQSSGAKIKAIALTANQTSTAEGSLKDGFVPADLSWAWNSAIACFPGTQKSKFTGKHVLFGVEMPARSIISVTVKPKKGGVNLSVYGYQIAAGKWTLPEELQSAVTCEADHKWDYPKRGKTQGDERVITFNSTTNRYNIVIGVAGADGLSDADFTVEVSLKQ